MKITFLLLAHQRPAIVKRLIVALTSAGHTVVLHYDKSASNADFEDLRATFSDPDKVRFASRVRVSWGEWSIVAAALNGLETIEASGWNPDYVYHISGADYPIRPASDLDAFLERHKGKDFIEGVPANTVIWVKGGPQKERYLYRHYFSWRDRRRLARSIMRIQRFFGLKRTFVAGMEPYIGSQWWVLTWDTLREILKVGRKPEVTKFFQRTLIPDELYFQTLVYNLIPKDRIVDRPLTLYQFTDYMVPVVFCADRLDYLLRQPFFFARKMSPCRVELFEALDEVWSGEHPSVPVPDAEMGKITPEYETTRLANRDGLSGVFIAGKVTGTWAETLRWVGTPFFGVLGTSSVELAFARRVLAGCKELLCHGQLLHPLRSDFVDGAESWAGYGATDMGLRNQSAPNFLSDIVRTAGGRQPGFLIRSGDGWHIPDVLFEQPAARVLVVHGDPLVGFIESLADAETAAEATAGTTPAPAVSPPLEAIPPTILVDRFDRYQQSSAQYRKHIHGLMTRAPRKGIPASWSWLVEVDLDVANSAKVPRRPSGNPRDAAPSAWVEATLDRWKDWFTQVEVCLGVELDLRSTSEAWTEFEAELRAYQPKRRLVAELLALGGRRLSVNHAGVASLDRVQFDDVGLAMVHKASDAADLSLANGRHPDPTQGEPSLDLPPPERPSVDAEQAETETEEVQRET